MDIFKTDLMASEKVQAGISDLWKFSLNLHLVSGAQQESDLRKRILERIDTLIQSDSIEKSEP
jgi:hypothetical protein